MCNKWILIDDKIIEEYDTSIINCLKCNRILYPYFLHSFNKNILSYYTCYICGKDGNIKHFCLTCKI